MCGTNRQVDGSMDGRIDRVEPCVSVARSRCGSSLFHFASHPSILFFIRVVANVIYTLFISPHKNCNDDKDKERRAIHRFYCEIRGRKRIEKTMADTTTPSDAPNDANAGCVGPTAESAGKASACDGCPNQGACSSGAFNSPEAKAQAQQQAQALQASLSNVSHVILVLSGKGGVGKSTVSAQLCHTLASQGFAVGLLDVDLCGPSAPRMVLGDNFRGATVTKNASGSWIPVYSSTHPNLACMSISFLLQDSDAAVVWRGKFIVSFPPSLLCKFRI